MIESNKVLCKICRELKVRTEDEKYPDKRNKRYKDEAGKLWNGRCCPPCAVKIMKERMRNLRFTRKLIKSQNNENNENEEEKA